MSLLTIDGVAKLLAVSARHVWELNKTGRLVKPVRLGRSVRWNSHEVEAWIEAGCPTQDRWEAHREGQQ